MTVSRLMIVHQPPGRVWEALQNELPVVARRLRDIESVKRLKKAKDRQGHVLTVHRWTVRSGLPASFESLSDGRALSWTERTVWQSDAFEAHWTVESELFGRSVTGAGITRLSAAMGGKATRMTFEVSTRMEPGMLGPLSATRWSNGLSSAAAAVLTKTLQDLCLALELFLDDSEAES